MDIYIGDESTYEVQASSRINRGCRKVTIVRLIDGPGSLPIGVTISVPSRKVIRK